MLSTHVSLDPWVHLHGVLYDLRHTIADDADEVPKHIVLLFKRKVELSINHVQGEGHRLVLIVLVHDEGAGEDGYGLVAEVGNFLWHPHDCRGGPLSQHSEKAVDYAVKPARRPDLIEDDVVVEVLTEADGITYYAALFPVEPDDDVLFWLVHLCKLVIQLAELLRVFSNRGVWNQRYRFRPLRISLDLGLFLPFFLLSEWPHHFHHLTNFVAGGSRSARCTSYQTKTSRGLFARA